MPGSHEQNYIKKAYIWVCIHSKWFTLWITHCTRKRNIWAILLKIYIYRGPGLQIMFYSIERSKYTLLISHTCALAKC